MMPDGWKKDFLGNLFDFKNGLNTEKENYGSGFKFVNVMDVFGNDVLTESKIMGRVQISEKQLSDYQLRYGDVLFNRTSETFEEIAMAAVYLDNALATFGGFVIRGRPKSNEILPEYLAFLFQSSAYRTQVIKLGQGAVRANIGQKDLAKVSVLIPTIKEQKKIIQILIRWDKAIVIIEKLLINGFQQKKSLMQQLLNGHTRLPGFSDRWMGGVLGDIATIDSGFAFKSNTFINADNGIPIIRMNNLKNGRLDISGAVKISPEITKGLERFSLLENDFLFGMSGSLNNYAWVTAKDLPCYLNQRVGRITAKNNHDQTFITYLYLSDKVRNSILDKAEGAAQLNISINDLRETPINYPAPKEQKKIAEILLSAENYNIKLQQKLHCLKQEKKALMQQLLTGKRRVKVDAA
ncbi:TPA: restriction endonuclease subunit S [Klebsiella variicola subsp. variicola]|nr:restriction endonuclease subunit S [Klebsiella variicola subsp. variicola]